MTVSADTWQRIATAPCAICGRVASPSAELGHRIEAHHLHGRGFPGADDPESLMGLCGVFVNGCHQAVTEHRIKLSEVDGVGWVWEDTRTGEQGICRRPSDVVIQPSVVQPLYDMRTGLPVESEYLPEAANFSDDSLEAAQGRVELVRGWVRRINEDTLRVALVVYEVAVRKEYARLGFESMNEWADAAEIPQQTMKQMVMVGKHFRGRWMELTPAQRVDLNIDRLRYAAMLHGQGYYETEDDALAAAASEPQRYLWQQYQETLEKGAKPCECPTCGHKHKDYS